MEIVTRLSSFIESSPSECMPEAAQQLLELIEGDAVEPIGATGRPVRADELADHLETRLSRARRQMDSEPEGIELIEDAVAHLRTYDDALVAPYGFEDSEGVRWFVLSRGSEVIACYTNRAFVEADV